MSVRKRKWATASGEAREAWIVDYSDHEGDRCIKTFAKKRDADAFAAIATVEISQGIHTPASKTITVAEAGEDWIKTAEANHLERTTIDEYRRHLDLHIVPRLGRTKLADLSVPMVRAFEDALLADKRSQSLVRKIRVSLGSIIADAQERGHVSRNVVRELRSRRKRGKEKRAERRQKGKLRVGADIPAPTEIRALIEATEEGQFQALFLVGIFVGLRASELRGLRWEDVDLKKRELHVVQRANIHGDIGSPKSEAGHRTVPITPKLAAVLTKWKLASKKSDLGVVFSTRTGAVLDHANLMQRSWWPLQLKAGVTKPVLDESGRPKCDEDGRPMVQAKYSGLHCWRHFFASWCINRVADGGLELPAKVVQARLGHSSITVTMDTYGHLFPGGDDSERLADAEGKLWGQG
ncbi:site-specific integrase [Bradyrhizobium sp. Ai1a-2]|uniref:tyrosine-type recombinase/integrase n=1 Tax=Bradyrhizobium sp. Ai1a-2 TaxID=196490 RepID=UPI000425DCA0|nr:site-specific integrase [Bradyrhizobium sp. Ai1a-2]